MLPEGLHGIPTPRSHSIVLDRNRGKTPGQGFKRLPSTADKVWQIRNDRLVRDAETVAKIIPRNWVRIDMGGPHADLSVEESVQAVADTIGGHSGKVGLHYVNYRGRTIRW